jgi:hypothetical protein
VGTPVTVAFLVAAFLVLFVLAIYFMPSPLEDGTVTRKIELHQSLSPRRDTIRLEFAEERIQSFEVTV